MVTGLTANTSCSVTVVAISICCGEGPVSDVIMIMTNMRPPTESSPTQGRTQDFLQGFPQIVDPRCGGLGVQPPDADELFYICYVTL